MLPALSTAERVLRFGEQRILNLLLPANFFDLGVQERFAISLNDKLHRLLDAGHFFVIAVIGLLIHFHLGWLIFDAHLALHYHIDLFVTIKLHVATTLA